VAQLCVNTLLATKVTLITVGISFGTLRVKETIALRQLRRDFGEQGGNMTGIFSPRSPDFPFYHYHSLSAKYSAFIHPSYTNLKLTAF
jgi:hypothetical protein